MPGSGDSVPAIDEIEHQVNCFAGFRVVERGREFHIAVRPQDGEILPAIDETADRLAGLGVVAIQDLLLVLERAIDSQVQHYRPAFVDRRDRRETLWRVTVRHVHQVLLERRQNEVAAGDDIELEGRVED